MTIGEAIRYAKRQLIAANIVDADSASRCLLGKLIKQSPAELLANLGEPLAVKQTNRYQKLVERRAHHEPLAYILGYQDFAGLRIAVDRTVLIPRPETERLVELVIDYVTKLPKRPLTIVDVGTGSGAIRRALAAELGNKVKLYATDIVARPNAMVADLLAPLNGQMRLPGPDIIVANLPYIPTARLVSLELEVRGFEPMIALDGGVDGLDLYRRLFDQVSHLPRLPKAIFCEIDESHGETIRRLAESRWPKATVALKKDLAGLDRYLIIHAL